MPPHHHHSPVDHLAAVASTPACSGVVAEAQRLVALACRDDLSAWVQAACLVSLWHREGRRSAIAAHLATQSEQASSRSLLTAVAALACSAGFAAAWLHGLSGMALLGAAMPAGAVVLACLRCMRHQSGLEAALDALALLPATGPMSCATVQHLSASADDGPTCCGQPWFRAHLAWARVARRRPANGR